MPSIKSISLKAYLVVLHLVILFLIAALALAIYFIRSDFRLPGSRLSTAYSNENDDWGYYIQHDDRDLLVGVTELPFGVHTIMVSPPDCQYVWTFDRDPEEDWKLYISDFGTPQRADSHLEDPSSAHMLIDGYPYGPLDGFPDREVLTEDSMKKFFRVEPIERVFDNEVPEG
ncbi:MAG: hypothetical protein JJ974_03565 [Phycisphaerales bacterium]|nr:hypothetical protein [Phycisphaerales bacterium]